MSSTPPDPYSAPAADLETPSESPPSRPWRGVIYGALADIGCSIVYQIIVMAVFSYNLAAQGAADAEAVMESIATQAQQPATALFIWIMVGGMLFSVLGGYICARFARRNEFRFAAVLCAILLVFNALAGGTEAGTLVNAALMAATFGCILAGTWLGVRRNRREDSDRATLAA